jgi:hypothetical protein
MEIGIETKQLPLVVTGTNSPSREYIEHERYEFNRTKQAQRELVARMFCEHLGGMYGKGLSKLLTFPGETWAFERMMHERKACEFIGLEWCWPVAERARRWMPTPQNASAPRRPDCAAGRTSDPRTRGVMSYELKTHLGSIIDGYKSGTAKVLNLCASGFFQMEQGDVIAPKYGPQKTDKRRWYSRTFREINAMWLDFTCGACPEVMDSLLHCHRGCSNVDADVPLVVTMMVGRDTLDLPVSHSPLGARTDFVMQLLKLNNERRPRLLDAWSYRSESDVTMASIAVILESLKDSTNG